MNRRSLASWPAQRNIPLAPQSPCSAAPDATASTADAMLLPTQTHPTWRTGKPPPPADLLVCGTSESGLASHLHPSPGILLFPQPAPAAAPHSPVQQSWLPSDFTASRGIHCQAVWAGSPQPAPYGFHREMEMHIRVPGTAPSSLPRACRAGRLPHSSFLGSSAQPWAVSQSLGERGCLHRAGAAAMICGNTEAKGC